MHQVVHGQLGKHVRGLEDKCRSGPARAAPDELRRRPAHARRPHHVGGTPPAPQPWWSCPSVRAKQGKRIPGAARPGRASDGLHVPVSLPKPSHRDHCRLGAGVSVSRSLESRWFHWSTHGVGVADCLSRPLSLRWRSPPGGRTPSRRSGRSAPPGGRRLLVRHLGRSRGLMTSRRQRDRRTRRHGQQLPARNEAGKGLHDESGPAISQADSYGCSDAGRGPRRR
jgi:hypothetical protein